MVSEWYGLSSHTSSFIIHHSYIDDVSTVAEELVVSGRGAPFNPRAEGPDLDMGNEEQGVSTTVGGES
jgi:hypothetical protein